MSKRNQLVLNCTTDLVAVLLQLGHDRYLIFENWFLLSIYYTILSFSVVLNIKSFRILHMYF